MTVNEAYPYFFVDLALSPSGFAWVETRTQACNREMICDLRPQDIAYSAILSVVGFLPGGSEVFVFTDSLFLRRNFNRFRSIDEIRFPNYETMARQMIEDKQMKVYMGKVKRARNSAGKLLESPAGRNGL